MLQENIQNQQLPDAILEAPNLANQNLATDFFAASDDVHPESPMDSSQIDPADGATLLIHGGLDDGATLSLSQKNQLAIGRSTDNDIVLNEPTVSRKHAEIVAVESGHLLRDKGSANGTQVNGREVGEDGHLLADGDEIKLGDSAVFFVYRCREAATLKMLKVDLRPITETTGTGVPTSEGNRPEASDGDRIVAPAGEGDGANLTDHEADNSNPKDEGNVTVTVHADGNVQLVVQFVHDLRQRSEIRLQRLTSEPDGGVKLWLGLREPLRLKDMLEKLQGVSSVEKFTDTADRSKGEITSFSVLLAPSASQ